ncbi:MAG: 3-deoxy-7-phosphoheptulonate synthase [Thermoplasmata archaeon]
MNERITDGNIARYRGIITPFELKDNMPASKQVLKNVEKSRKEIDEILDKKSSRKIIIAGPCSIHNIDEAKEYAEEIKDLSEIVEDKFLLVMRTYFEKPRTTIGWKGLISDPYLDGSHDMNTGLKHARELLLYTAGLEVPTGTEILNTESPQYLDDLISWSAIGARTTESQPHRELASGLTVPVGFKNDTGGNVKIAVDAVKTAKYPHSFRGIDQGGKICIVETTGNPYSHVVLRGGKVGGEYRPNYDYLSIERTTALLEKENLPLNIVVDCSHGNSGKDHNKQPKVFKHLIEQIESGNQEIIGLMLESNLKQGNQSFSDDPSELKRGVSITDSCIGWDTTKEIILEAYHR